jgi:hypothetical protein
LDKVVAFIFGRVEMEMEMRIAPPSPAGLGLLEIFHVCPWQKRKQA